MRIPTGAPGLLPILIGCALWSVTLAGAQSGKGVHRWPGWEQYQVVLWSTDESLPPGWFNGLRQAGFTAEQCPAYGDCRPYADAHFGFYAENLASQLGFLNSRKPIFTADWNGYSSTQNARYLMRKPCFDDPAFWGEITPKVTESVRKQAGNHPLAYDLRDEPSVASLASPFDYCFCPHTMRAFREWLQTQYPSLSALNQEWGSAFASWNDVVPPTTFEMKATEKAGLASGKPENYAAWADHRAYMDYAFAKTIDRLRTIVHKLDPKTPVGIAGAQMPSAWGGYDLWKLSQSVDWIEPYDVANSRVVLRSFLPPQAPVLATYFGGDVPQLRLQAWRQLLNGDRGAIVWDDTNSRVIQRTNGNLAITERGRNLKALFEPIRKLAQVWTPLSPVSDHIAIHYSQASIRAHWMFDSREDGNTWLRRFSSYEAKESRLAHVRDSFLTIVEDLGLTPDFVSYEEIERGDLIRRGYKVLLLPQSVALSTAECRAIETFVRGGGTVVADAMVATMDQHDRRLARGQLDDLFGVRQKLAWKRRGDGPRLPTRQPGGRDWSVFDGALVAGPDTRRAFPDASMVLERKTGSGTAVFLNLDMHDYAGFTDRRREGSGYRALFEAIFKSAGVVAPVQVSGPSPVMIWRRSGPSSQFVAVLRHTPSAPAKATERIHLTLPGVFDVLDRSREVGLGKLRDLDLELHPTEPILLELRPVAR